MANGAVARAGMRVRAFSVKAGATTLAPHILPRHGCAEPSPRLDAHVDVRDATVSINGGNRPQSGSAPGRARFQATCVGGPEVSAETSPGQFMEPGGDDLLSLVAWVFRKGIPIRFRRVCVPRDSILGGGDGAGNGGVGGACAKDLVSQTVLEPGEGEHPRAKVGTRGNKRHVRHAIATHFERKGHLRRLRGAGFEMCFNEVTI